MMSAILVYMTKQYIIHKDSNRLKEPAFKNRPTEEHVSPYVTVKARQYIRMNDPQMCTEFFIFESRHCDFERFKTMVNKAIEKIGWFSFVFFYEKLTSIKMKTFKRCYYQ